MLLVEENHMGASTSTHANNKMLYMEGDRPSQYSPSRSSWGSTLCALVYVLCRFALRPPCFGVGPFPSCGSFASAWSIYDLACLTHLSYLNRLSLIHLSLFVGLARTPLCRCCIPSISTSSPPQVWHVEMLQSEHLQEVTQFV